MTLQMLRRSMLVLALAAPLASAPTATAAVTSTAVTAPADGTKLWMDDSPGAAAHEVAFSGTSTGATGGDTVDLLCYGRQNSSFDPLEPIQAGIPVDVATGTWSSTTDVSHVRAACTVRAVPGGTAPTATLATFTGPTVYFGGYALQRVASGINAGKVHEWSALFGRTAGQALFGSARTAAMSTLRPLTGANVHRSPIGLANGWKLQGTTGDLVDAYSGIMVDGAYAWHPEAIFDYGLFGTFEGEDLVGFPGVDLTLTEIDPATGVPGAVETYPIVRCNAGQHLAAPDATCSQFVATGVRMTRTFSFPDGTRTALVRDDWTSVDGAAHSVAVQYSTDYPNLVSGEPFAMSWLAGDTFAPRPDGDVTAPSTSPWTMRGIRDPEAADGDIDAVRSARVTSSAPNAVRFAGGPWKVQERHAISVPAGGSTSVTTAFIVGVSQAEVDGRVRHYTDRFVSPVVSILAPASGSSTSDQSVAVTGTATDNVGIASVTVNGVAATVAPGGAFTANAPLALGANTITVVASDAAGNATTASVVVTRTAPPVPPVTPTPPQVRFVGTAGADTLRGNAVGNVLLGLGGNDRLFCGAGGRDTASGGAGNDRVDCVEPYASARANRDAINCGGGTKDIVLVDPFDAVKSCELVTRVWTGAARADRWRGTRANDRFNTLAGNDSVTCGGGRDTASLGAGNDTVNCADTGSASARRKSRDIVNCGAGRTDRAIVDRYDIVRFCERVTRR